jgi:DNA modification methylase
MLEMNRAYWGDWIGHSREHVADKSVKLLIADPPYFEVKGEFDFGIWPTFEDYLRDVRLWAIECKRILADNGTLLWYGDAKKIAYAQVIFDEYFDLLNSLVWDKGNFLGLEYSLDIRSFAPCTERILVYVNNEAELQNSVFFIRDYIRGEIMAAKGKIVLSDINEALGTATNGGGVASACLSLNKSEPAMITEDMYKILQNWCAPFMSRSYSELRAKYNSLRRVFNPVFNLQEVLKFSNEQNTTGAKYDHPTVKPESLTRAFILTLSNPGDMVLIPFAGSGTECAMCERERRPFLAFDVSEKYVNMTNNRVLNIKSAPKLDLC